MEVAGLLSSEQLNLIFLNVEELIESNRVFTGALKESIELALDDGDEDLCTVNIGKVFVGLQEDMLHAFKSYCTRQVRPRANNVIISDLKPHPLQASSSTLLANLEKEKELLKIFLRVSQMENVNLRRMNLSSFLMVKLTLEGK